MLSGEYWVIWVKKSWPRWGKSRRARPHEDVDRVTEFRQVGGDGRVQPHRSAAAQAGDGDSAAMMPMITTTMTNSIRLKEAAGSALTAVFHGVAPY